MKPIAFALIAAVLYASQNLVMEARLKQYSVPVILIGYYVTMLVLAVATVCHLRVAGKPIAFPPSSQLWVLGAVVVTCFVADMLYVGAYAAGGNVVVITMMLILMPVFSALVKFLVHGEAPTGYHVAGFTCAALAVTCVALGNRAKEAAKPPPAAVAPASNPA